MNLSKQIKGSIATRTALLVLMLVAIVLSVTEVWQIVYVRRIVSKEMHQQATSSLEGAVKVIDKHVSTVESSVVTAASYANMFAPHEMLSYTLLESLIKGNEDIAAVTLLYRNNFFPDEGRYFAPTISRDPVTKKLSTYDIGGPDYQFNYLETDSNWVYSNKLDGGYWCLPFVDSMKTNRTFITYSVPLHDKVGSIYAVLCAAVDLNWIQDVVKNSKPYSFSYVTLLSRDGKYLCHPDSSYILTKYALDIARETNNDKEFRLMKRMLDGESGNMALDAKSTPLPDSMDLEGDFVVYYAPIDRVKWAIAFTIPKDKILEEPNILMKNMILLLLLLLGIISSIIYVVIKSQLNPMRALAESTRDIAQGNFNVKLPAIKTNDEIRHFRDVIEDMQTSLGTYVEKLRATTASKASMESELKVASNIQKSMLPKVFPPFPERNDLDIFGLLKPAKRVGGDLYDFYLRDEKLVFCIGDVSGKGVPAALVMAVTRSLFRTLSTRESNPARIVMGINEAMCNQNSSNMFTTLFVGVLDLPTGRLHYCNAGHNPPLLIGREAQLLPVESNVPVGTVSQWKYSLQNVEITPGTAIFLYTDGLPEAEDKDNNQLGDERMMEKAQEAAIQMGHSADGQGGHAEMLVNVFADAVREFVGNATPSDDLTLLAIEYTKKTKETLMQRSITLPNDVQTLPQLNAFVDEISETLQLDASTNMQLNLAIEEAVVNVMKYAYPQGMTGEVDIEAQADDTKLIIIIRDEGAPFDPTTMGDADVTLSAEDRPIGGLGIFIVRQYMDSINYERVDNTNVLTLRKNLGSLPKA